MKNTALFYLQICILSISACSKDNARFGSGVVAITPAPIVTRVTNTAPHTFAGSTQLVLYPSTSCLLEGSAWDNENNIHHFTWRKISGPAGDEIVTPSNMQTQVRNLTIGKFKYEFTAIDDKGLQSSDTVVVIVDEVGDNEKLFVGLQWTYPWYATLEISTFNKYVPDDKVFRVYVRRSNGPDWVEATPIGSDSGARYDYFVERRVPNEAGMNTTGSLYIFYYGDGTNDSPDVKVVF